MGVTVAGSEAADVAESTYSMRRVPSRSCCSQSERETAESWTSTDVRGRPACNAALAARSTTRAPMFTGEMTYWRPAPSAETTAAEEDPEEEEEEEEDDDDDEDEEVAVAVVVVGFAAGAIVPPGIIPSSQRVSSARVLLLSSSSQPQWWYTASWRNSTHLCWTEASTTKRRLPSASVVNAESSAMVKPTAKGCVDVVRSS